MDFFCCSQRQVHRLTRVNLVFDAVKTGHEHRSVGQIGVCGRVRRTELDALGLGALAVGWDTDRRGAVALAVDQIHRRFKPGHQPLVAVGSRVGDSDDRTCMLKDAADVVQRHLAETGVFVASKEGLIALPQTLVSVHTAAVVLKKWLGHEGCC